MKNNKKIYFVSDVHLGAPNFEESLQREKLLVKWLEEKSKDAEAFYLLGDIFDFWFEYKRVVPRGFTRLLGTLARLTDSGIPVYFFTGNHDLWVFDYLPRETGVKVVRSVISKEISGKKFYIGHGDGLGSYDKGYNFLKLIFRNRFLQWCFKRIHPNFSVGFAHRWSKSSRKKHKYPENINFEKEWLVKHARDILKSEHYDYFVFGHRHIPIDYYLSDKSKFINIGDWINNFSYGVFDGSEFKLHFYKKEVNS